jgi:hypothetical protein
MRIVGLIVVGAFAFGCAQGNCRSQSHTPSTPEAAVTNSSPTGKANIEPAAASTERVRVFKYDGSLQCGMGKAIAAEQMAKELKGIQVFSSTNKADGLMHIMQCGTPTGRANVYEIERKDLAAAQKAGFKEWLWE